MKAEDLSKNPNNCGEVLLLDFVSFNLLIVFRGVAHRAIVEAVAFLLQTVCENLVCP